MWLLSHGIRKEAVNTLCAARFDGLCVSQLLCRTPTEVTTNAQVLSGILLDKNDVREVLYACGDFTYSDTLPYKPWAVPVARVGGDIRANWNARTVSLWLRSRRISQGIAHTLYAAKVDGLRLYRMFYAGHAGVMEKWIQAGVPNPQDVRSVLKACMDLDHYSWMLPYRWLSMS